jgi:hypothetical protein
MRKALILLAAISFPWLVFAAITEWNGATISYWTFSEAPYYFIERKEKTTQGEAYYLSNIIKTHHVWVARAGIVSYYKNGKPAPAIDGIGSLLEIREKD